MLSSLSLGFSPLTLGCIFLDHISGVVLLLLVLRDFKFPLRILWLGK